VITDIDMPRLDGIGLLERIRRDPRLQRLPVMIVSYKDRPEDRARGLEAGADLPGQGRLPRRHPARRRARPDRRA
jgi:CheY-like chemotaxis protein